MRWLLILLFLLPTKFLAAGEEEKTYIIQETLGSYWYCPITAPNCFWYSYFHDRYYCQDFKEYSGIKCEETDPPVERKNPCKFPPDIDVGYCYGDWQGYNFESLEQP